jgi:hypothetical protein
MLQHYNNGHRRAISGAGLAQLRRRMSAAERACLAADIVDGRVVLQGLTVKAIAALVGVNQGYVDRALRLTPEQREQVRHGDRPLVSPRPCADFDALRAAAAAPIDWEAIGDEMLVEAVRKIGIDRALNAVIVAEDTEA